MEDFLRHRWVVRTAQIATALVFLAAALPKISDVPQFAKDIAAYQLAPVWSHHLLAMTLPWIELVVALALLAGIRERAAAVVATGAMVVFTLAVVWAWSKGLSIDCGCFGKGASEPVGASKLLQNVGLTALAAVAAVRARGA
ncbi:MAG TPA: MauE/DoxX family redox-associated membrane protein [Candidatus Polarisedimenticolaceae bacterium]